MSIQSIKFLVGRIFVFTLYPFSFEEYLNYKNPDLYGLLLKANLSKPVIERILPYFNEFCIYGGYPRVLLAKDKDEKELVLKNIYNTYFLKEIKEILNLPDDYRLTKLIHALALQTGGIANYHEISNITGFKYNELLRHLNILEKTFIIIKSLPFYTNKRTELVKAPKIFFLDSGFRNVIIKNFLALESRTDKGSLYENFTAGEIIKSGFDVKYWRTKSMAEVDFIIEKNEDITPIEIKSSLTKEGFTKSFGSFLEKYKPRNSLILSEKLFGEKGKTKFRPIFCISKEIKNLTD